MRSTTRVFHLVALTVLAAAITFAACGFEPTEIRIARDIVRQDLAGQPLVISQLFGGGGSATGIFNADFVELHNTTGNTVFLGGYSLQYGSATGNSWGGKINLPDAGMRPGGYFLVRMTNPSGSVGSPVPADFSANVVDLSQSNGKVALVNSTTSMPTGICPSTAAVDFVGYGTANCAEGTAAAAMTATSALERVGNGCVDTDSNTADFIARRPLPDGGPAQVSPRNAASAAVVCNQPTDGGVVLVPCGTMGDSCLPTECCEDLGFITNCLQPNDICGNDQDMFCSAATYTCEPIDPNADAGVRSVGSPCSNDSQCRADMGALATCKRATSPSGVTYKNGYCTVLCSPAIGCPGGSACIDPAYYGEETMCWDSCGIGDPCRSGYQCVKDTQNKNLGCWIMPTPPPYVPPDAGVVDGGPVEVDAGSQPPFDAGTPVDAGTTPVDAGTVDAGTPGEDAGTMPPVDAGTNPADSGTPGGSDAGTTDAGTGAVDSGTPKVDAGTQTDAGTKVDAGVKRDAGMGGTLPVEPEKPGCGCSTTEAGALLPFALAFLFRRRRSAASR